MGNMRHRSPESIIEITSLLDGFHAIVKKNERKLQRRIRRNESVITIKTEMDRMVGELIDLSNEIIDLIERGIVEKSTAL